MKFNLPILLFLAVAGVSCMKESSFAPEPEVHSRYQEGVLNIKVDEDLAAALEAAEPGTKAGEALMARLGVSSARRVFPDAGMYEPRTRRAGLHRWYTVTCDTRTRSAADLMGTPGVEYAEAPRKIRHRSFNDPYLKYQWQYINPNVAGADINVQKVWEQLSVGSPDVVVAVCDDGLDMDHEDLAWNVIPAGPGGSRNIIGNSYYIYPANPHGTHIAGTIAAVNNNGIGVCGIAGGDYATARKGVRLLSCQIFDIDGDSSTEGCANAIKYGADNGAVISQNSWGDYADANNDGIVSTQELLEYKSVLISRIVKEAIDYFNTYAGCDNDGNQLPDSPMKGGLVLFAAGNEAIDYDPICCNADVLAVGATGPTGKAAYYSNYGDWVDIAAPGGDTRVSFQIEGTTQNAIYSLLLDNTYGNKTKEGYFTYSMIGTSMACPHASGVAALVVAANGGPGFTRENLKECLVEGCTVSIPKIGKKLDAYEAVTYMAATPELLAEGLDNRLVTIGESAVADLSSCFTDRSGRPLSLDVTADADFVSVEADGMKLRLTGRKAGKCGIVVRAFNGLRYSTSLSFQVTVREPRRTDGQGDYVIDVYPNPVERELYIRGGEQTKEAAIEIVSATGKLVFRRSGVDINAWNPIQIDMQDSAPGKYQLVVTVDGHPYQFPIVKI